ncbi:YdaU family protein [Burkholderia cenocepacia]|uniref:YdaU family protein n=1 Tax=Burkholderia cenocepacia TaxID=95486 RepID=UPI001B9F6CD9|nr:YdaU family protein [Burkholderia cenocepacia]MBR8443252.1 YdaU family protein [Burkholderia cenocepacia]
MNYYPHHIGDFRSGTVNMTRVERWIYRDLIDVYYDTEKPLPLDLDAVCYAVGVSAEDERRAVANLLRFKFTQTDAGYVHDRCEIEIAAYRLRAETAQENGKKGGRPKKRTATGSGAKQNPSETQEKPTGFPSGSNPDASGPPDITGSKTNQEPITNNQEVNISGGTAQAVGDDTQNAAAAFVEILRNTGIAFAADDERVRSWPALGATPIDLRTAIQVGLLRRKRENSTQPLNIGLLNSLLPEAIAQRTGRAGTSAPAAASGPWHTSWPGIVAHGRTLGLEQDEHETCPDFKLRVLRAAGDGPWWDEHNRAFRNSAGPVAAGSILEAGR